MIYKRKPSNFNPSFEIVSCFLEYNKKILLLKRNENKPQGDKWGVAAGKINDNEDKISALEREIEEETGIVIPRNELIFFKSIYVKHEEDFMYHIFYHRLSNKPKIKINSREHNEFKWIMPETSSNLSLVDDLNECIKMYYFKQ